MISIEDVRKAKITDLYFAQIKKRLTWEEAENVKVYSDEYPNAKTPGDLLRIAVRNVLSRQRVEVTEQKIRECEEDVKKAILSGLEETQHTILLKKGDEYFDLATMQMLEEEYEVVELTPFCMHGSESDYSFENTEKGLIFNLEEGVFEKYLNDHSKK